MRYEALIHPYVTVAVDHDGDSMKVAEVTIDWSDTLVNLWAVEDGQQTHEAWADGQPGDTPPEAEFAAAYVDRDDVRARVLAALQPNGSMPALTEAEIALISEALDSYEYWEHREYLPHDSGHITILDDQDFEAQVTLSGRYDEDEMEAASEAWEAVKAARALDAKLHPSMKEQFQANYPGGNAEHPDA